MATTASKEYIKLIKRFPLRRIRSKSEHSAAMEILDELMEREATRSQDETDYLSILAQLIEEWEENLPELRQSIQRATATTPADALIFLMEANGLTQSQLAREIGCDQSAINAFLAGRRGLSKANALKLAERFRVSVSFFLPLIQRKAS